MIDQKSQGAHFYDFLYTLFKRKYLALAIFFTTFVGIIFGTYLVTPMWKATAKVRVQYNPKQQLAMFEGITTPGAIVPGINPANDVIHILTSRELAEEVVKEFDRDKLWEKRKNEPESTRDIIRLKLHDTFIGTPIGLLQDLGILTKKPDNYLAMAVEEFEKDLQDIQLESDTSIINVSVWGESYDVATDMSNTLVGLLLEKNLDASRKPINSVLALTNKQMAEAEENLRAVQEELRTFKEQKGLVLYDEEASILLHRLDNYESELISMERQMMSMKIEKSADHPDVMGLAARINELRDDSIPKAKNALMSLPLKEVELARLSQELKVRENLYLTLKQKLLELELLRNSSLGDFELQVVDSAKVYSFVRPDWPRWVISIPLGIIGSFFVSIIFVFFVEFWNSSFKSVKDLEESVSVPVLGAIPKFNPFSKNKLYESSMLSHIGNIGTNLTAIQTDNKNRSLVTPYALLTDAILLRKNDAGNKRLLITSPGPVEGKTTISAGFGCALAMKGKKVLLLEANFRAPSLNRYLNVNMDKGLVDYCAGDLEVDDIIVDVNGMHVIFAGNVSERQTDYFEMISSKKMKALLDEIRV